MKFQKKHLLLALILIVVFALVFLLNNWKDINAFYQSSNNHDIVVSVIEDMDQTYSIYKDSDPSTSIAALKKLVTHIIQATDSIEPDYIDADVLNRLFFDLGLTYGRLSLKYEEIGDTAKAKESLKKAEEYVEAYSDLNDKIPNIREFLINLDKGQPGRS